MLSDRKLLKLLQEQVELATIAPASPMVTRLFRMVYQGGTAIFLIFVTIGTNARLV